jgi:hypothetical protein
MLRRGDDVPPNTRLEYLYIECPGSKHQGEGAEDYTYYRENKSEYKFKPNYLHYIEKQLTNPVMELIFVKYPRQMVPYEKLDDAILRLIEGLEEFPLYNIRQFDKPRSVYERTVEEKVYPSYRVGWAAYSSKTLGPPQCNLSSYVGCKKCSTLYPEKCRKHRVDTKPEKYVYKKLDAKVQYILDSANRKKENPKAKREIDETKHSELLDACRKWKSRVIVDALHRRFGIRKRTVKRPTQTGEKLRITKEGEPISVILTKKYKTYPKGEVVLLKGIVEEIVQTSMVRNKKKYTYTIQTSDEKLHTGVPRDTFTTWYYKDGTVMKDILLYRGSFQVVIRELNKLFNPDNDEEIKLFEVQDENLDEAD